MRFQVAESRCKYGQAIFSPASWNIRWKEPTKAVPFYCEYPQWKVFFSQSLRALVYTGVYTRERSKWKRKGGEGKKAERRGEERSQKVRRVPPLMNAATSGHHVFPSLVRPTTKHPPAHPSGRFSNPSPNRDWTLVHVGMRIRGIHFADRRRCTNRRAQYR